MQVYGEKMQDLGIDLMHNFFLILETLQKSSRNTYAYLPQYPSSSSLFFKKYQHDQFISNYLLKATDLLLQIFTHFLLKLIDVFAFLKFIGILFHIFGPSDIAFLILCISKR